MAQRSSPTTVRSYATALSPVMGAPDHGRCGLGRGHRVAGLRGSGPGCGVGQHAEGHRKTTRAVWKPPPKEFRWGEHDRG